MYAIRSYYGFLQYIQNLEKGFRSCDIAIAKPSHGDLRLYSLYKILSAFKKQTIRYGTIHKFERVPGIIKSTTMPVTLSPIPTEKGMTLERISIPIKRLAFEKTRRVYIQEVLTIFI